MKRQVFFSPRSGTILFWSLLSLAALSLSSCDLLRESPFEVTAWNPGNGFFPGFSETSIYFVFSHEADHISVERAFTLTENGGTVTGYFSWDGKRCAFSPASPFRQNSEYRVTILQDAMDTRGLSMDGHFEGRFYTREDGNRPEVVAVDPPYDGVMNGARGTLTLEFSEPVDSLSLVQELTLSPSMTGSWALDAEGREAQFTPLEPWRYNTLYQLRLSGNFLSVLGISMGSEFSSRFRTGLDTDPPRLERAFALDMEETELFELERDSSENSLWEGNYRIGLVFSEPIDSASLKSRIAVHGGPAPLMESP
ncbi:MAG: Ig-like domain-containing protein, partial [Spirochaetaceae bacterium]|nr:Ig-like domain-containing protein [Spirochaetaceae bacterium]